MGNEVRVEYVWVPGRRGELVNTGRARLIVNAEVTSELAADVLARLRDCARTDAHAGICRDAGEGI